MWYNIMYDVIPHDVWCGMMLSDKVYVICGNRYVIRVIE